MNDHHYFPCPNCGGDAIRRYFVSREAAHSSCPDYQVTSTECSSCDYLMTVCTLSGRVIESSSSQFSVITSKKKEAKVKVFSLSPPKSA